MRIPPSLLEKLNAQAGIVDQTDEWPTQQLRWLADEGILGWVIPRSDGGSEVTQLELVRGYEDLASACLTTAFILTQRNGACQRIAGCDNDTLQRELLPRLATGELFATVGISHLTTSRQYLKTPAVAVDFRGDEMRLRGSIPWVTGAAHADLIVTGGTCADGQQVLVALPTSSAGVEVHAAAELMALTASQTATVDLHDVVIPAQQLLAGPVPEVMKLGLGGGTGSQVTSTLALGHAARSAELIRQQAEIREDLREISLRFLEEVQTLRDDLYRSLEGDAGNVIPEDNCRTATVPTSAEIRQRANSLVLRITQAAMAISKGAGFIRGHAAERSVREAMFFLVWSCPQPVVLGVLEELTCREGF